MAFSGVHVMVSEIVANPGAAPLPGQIILANTLAASGAVGRVSPDREGSALMRVESTVDGFIGTSEADAATALNKSASATLQRRLVRGGNGPYDFIVKKGDYIAWTVA